jgi:hypothetical protein
MIDAAFINELIQSPLGQTLIEQRAERARARRAELVTRRRELKRERDRVGITHARAVGTCRQARDAADKKLREATTALVDAERAMLAMTAPLDSELGRIERELNATIDPRLTAAINQLLGVDRGEWTICEVGRDGLGRAIAKTNGAAVRRLTEAHSLALASLRALAFEAPDDLDAAIAAALQPFRDAEAARGTLDGDPSDPAAPPKRRFGAVFGRPASSAA